MVFEIIQIYFFKLAMYLKIVLIVLECYQFQMQFVISNQWISSVSLNSITLLFYFMLIV